MKINKAIAKDYGVWYNRHSPCDNFECQSFIKCFEKRVVKEIKKKVK